MSKRINVREYIRQSLKETKVFIIMDTDENKHYYGASNVLTDAPKSLLDALIHYVDRKGNTLLIKAE